MNALLLALLRGYLYEHEVAVLVLAKAPQVVPAATPRAHDVQPEVVDVWINVVRRETCLAAGASPHGPDSTPAHRGAT